MARRLTPRGMQSSGGRPTIEDVEQQHVDGGAATMTLGPRTLGPSKGRAHALLPALGAAVAVHGPHDVVETRIEHAPRRSPPRADRRADLLRPVNLPARRFDGIKCLSVAPTHARSPMIRGSAGAPARGHSQRTLPDARSWARIPPLASGTQQQIPGNSGPLALCGVVAPTPPYRQRRGGRRASSPMRR